MVSGKRKPRVCRREAVGAWVLFALYLPVLRVSQHQKSAGQNRNGLMRNELFSVVAVAGGRLRTRKPFIHAVVAVFSVVAVKNTPP
jgi:hypothetical protein